MSYIHVVHGIGSRCHVGRGTPRESGETGQEGDKQTATDDTASPGKVVATETHSAAVGGAASCCLPVTRLQEEAEERERRRREGRIMERNSHHALWDGGSGYYSPVSGQIGRV